MRHAFLAVAVLFALCAAAWGIAVTPAEPDPDGNPTALDVETAQYKIRFDLHHIGSGASVTYKPLDHEFRAENYYSTPCTFLRGVLRLAEPDPITGLTRRLGGDETKRQARTHAAWKVLKQTGDEVVIEFAFPNRPDLTPDTMRKLTNRRRVILRNDTPAIRVERDVVNEDAEDHSVVLDFFNSASLGKVRTVVAIPSAEGKETGIDRAVEGGSSFLLVPRVAGSWIGGVNQKGFGLGFSYDWADVDAMQVCMWKTVGATYHVVTRRINVPAGKALTFRYTFMPFTGFASLDGMAGDLAGGVTVGEKAGFEKEVITDALKPGATVPVNVTLASGHNRTASVRITCTRQEDGVPALDETAGVTLKTAETATLARNVTFPEAGLYVLRVAATGEGEPELVMERGLEVGRSKLTYEPTPPVAAQRGKRDPGENMSTPRFDEQFRTLDQAFVTRHEPFLKNHVGGAVKAFVLTRADSTLAHVREIMERGDFDYEVAVCEKVGNPKGALHPTAFREFEKRFKAAEPDVFLALAIDSEKGLKQKFLRVLFDRVSEGLGAVITGPALKEQPVLAKMLADCTPVSDVALPACAVPVRPAKRYTHGKGRVVYIEQALSYGRDDGFLLIRPWTELKTAEGAVPIPEFNWRGFEYAYAHLGQVLRWAAKKESPVVITGAALQGRDVVVSVLNRGAEPVRGWFEVLVRSRRWDRRAGDTEYWDGVRPALGMDVKRAKTTLPPGVSTHTVGILGRPGAGASALEVKLASPQTVAFASVGINVPGPGVSLVVSPQRRVAESPGVCSVSVKNVGKGETLRVFVTDRFGRRVFDETRTLKPGDARTLTFGLAAIRPLCIYHQVVAQRHKDEQLLAEDAATMLLTSSVPPYRTRFMAGIAGSPERKALHIQGMLAAARSVGFDLHSHCYGDEALFWSRGTAGGYAMLRPKRKHQNNIFTPPLAPDDEWIEKTKARWQKGARALHDRGFTYVQIDDERRMSGEYDWSPRTLAAFRKHLATVYPDIAALNRTWGADFKSFDDVMPKTRKELGDADNRAPWLDFRMFCGDLFGRWYMQAPAEWAAEIAPDISVGELGIYLPTADWPVDWSKYAKYYRDTGHYTHGGEMIGDLIRSFSPGTNHGTWQGYGMRHIAPGRRVQLWRSLLNGGHWAWFWAWRDSGGWNYSLCTNDLRVTEGYRALGGEELPDIKGGLDRILFASKRLDDKVALAYSYPSWLIDPAAHGVTSKTILEELGLTFTCVNLEDAAKDKLIADKYRLLVIQQASCISAEQVAGIRRFAEQGGRVLVVGRSGWRDAHGAPHAGRSPLDALAGVDTSAATALNKKLVAQGELGPLSLTVESRGIAAKGASLIAAANDGDAVLPVLTRHAVGKGEVFWLNSTLAGHAGFFSGGVAGEMTAEVAGPQAVRATHHRIFGLATSKAGVTPRSKLLLDGKPLHGWQAWHYVTPSGRTRIIARFTLADLGKPLTLELPRDGHVYDLRTHKDYGVTDRVEAAFPSGRVNVFALTDYQVTGVTVALGADAVTPGGVVHLTAGVETKGNEADLHALRVTVLGPDKQPLAAHADVLLAPNGSAETDIPLALNAAKGAWTVRVQDAISGKTGEATFAVE